MSRIQSEQERLKVPVGTLRYERHNVKFICGSAFEDLSYDTA
jgi:hypothetical protein